MWSPWDSEVKLLLTAQGSWSLEGDLLHGYSSLQTEKKKGFWLLVPLPSQPQDRRLWLFRWSVLLSPWLWLALQPSCCPSLPWVARTDVIQAAHFLYPGFLFMCVQNHLRGKISAKNPEGAALSDKKTWASNRLCLCFTRPELLWMYLVHNSGRPRLLVSAGGEPMTRAYLLPQVSSYHVEVQPWKQQNKDRPVEMMNWHI